MDKETYQKVKEEILTELGEDLRAIKRNKWKNAPYAEAQDTKKGTAKSVDMSTIQII